MRSIISSVLEEPKLGLLRYINAQILSPNRMWFFHVYGGKYGPQRSRALVLQLWCPGCRVTFYPGSHLAYLTAKRDPENSGLQYIPQDHFKPEQLASFHFKHGG